VPSSSALKIGWAFAWRTLVMAELVLGASSGKGGLGFSTLERLTARKRGQQRQLAVETSTPAASPGHRCPARSPCSTRTNSSWNLAERLLRLDVVPYQGRCEGLGARVRSALRRQLCRGDLAG
jgi:hypothetical protein